MRGSLIDAIGAALSAGHHPLEDGAGGGEHLGDHQLLGVHAEVVLRIGAGALEELDALGGWTVDWDSTQKAAVASSGSTRLTATPSKDTIQINQKTLRGNVTLSNGRTYVPLRLVAEALGNEVEWDPYLQGASVTSAHADYDAEDLYWLSRIIHAESRGESLEGQIAVGNVVLNRVKSKEFPNTVSGVIFDRRHAVQFEPVANGTLYQTPNTQSVEAAKRALDGESVVGNALYFYAPALSQGTWINANRVYHMTIGCHRFYL